MATVKTRKAKIEKAIRRPDKVPVQLQINGGLYQLNIEPRRTLLDVLRDDLNLTGTKKVCNLGECGACTVVLDGKTAYSCLLLAIECEGHRILTIEGLSQGANLHPIQQAFIEQDAFQCGFCTPGQIMSVYALLEKDPNPSQEEIRRALAGNLCRCGAYSRILAAVEAAAKKYSELHPGKGK